VKKHAAFKWKDAVSGFPVSPGSAEALFRCGGKIKYILTAYFLGNIYAKNCCNRTVYVKIIASCTGGTFFWDTVYNVPAQETAKHRAKFGRLLLSDVGAAMKPSCETCWNLLGCPKLLNRSQPLVGQSSPYCENIEELLLFNKLFSDCQYIPYLWRYSPINMCDGAQMAIFCIIFAFCVFSEPLAAQFRHVF